MTVQYRTALFAKEKGFDLECRYYFDVKKFGERPVGFFGKLNANTLTTLSSSGEVVSCNYITCPLQAELQKWLREKHNIDVFVVPYFKWNEKKHKYGYFILHLEKDTDVDDFYEYEAALEEGLYEALKLIKDET